MFCRLRSDVYGDFHSQRVDGLYGVRKGDIVDLEPRDVLRYLKINLVELKLHGDYLKGDHPNGADIAKLEKQLRDEEAKKPPAGTTRTLVYDGAAYVYPA